MTHYSSSIRSKMDNIIANFSIMSRTNPGWEELSQYNSIYKINRCAEIVNINTGKLLKTKIHKGTVVVGLCDNQGQHTEIGVGITVARMFVSNPEGYADISYNDYDNSNCKADNLRWVPYYRKGWHNGKGGDIKGFL